MIRVVKPAAPARLAAGLPLVQNDTAAFDLDAAAYTAGTRSFDIDRAIYGDAAVKNVLRAAQHSKCCFCEGIFEANAAADVEHYRPKKYAQQGRKQPRLYPGYYWLGYEWANLYYSCQVCNRSHKKNFFPLRDPASRVRDHHGNLADEAPLILDPGGPDDPRNHIRFRSEVAVGITDAGVATVDYVGLNRDPLVEDRLERFQLLAQLKNVADLLGADPEAAKQALAADARAQLAAWVLPTSKFSAMASDFVNGTGIP